MSTDSGVTNDTTPEIEDDDEIVDYSMVPTFKVHYTLTGDAPLLMHCMTGQQIEEVLLRGDRPVKDTKSPLRVLAEKGLYLDPDKTIALPRKVLFAACKEAGRGIKLQGAERLSTKDATKLTKSRVRFLEEWYPVTPARWEPHLERGMLNGKTAVGIVRPMFPEWSISGTMIVIEHGGFNLAKAFQMLDLAGELCGLGAWRPKKNGEFGTFKVTRFDYGRVQIADRPSFASIAHEINALPAAK